MPKYPISNSWSLIFSLSIKFITGSNLSVISKAYELLNLREGKYLKSYLWFSWHEYTGSRQCGKRVKEKKAEKRGRGFGT